MARNLNYMGFSSDENSSDDEQRRAAVSLVSIRAAPKKQEKKQKEQSEVLERFLSVRFFPVASVLLRYLTVISG